MATNPLRPLVPRLRDAVAPAEAQVADRELLRRFGTAGDEAAFAEVVRRHGPMLLRVCQRVLRDAHAAEDVAQAAFLLLARKASSIRWHDSVAGWLFQTAYCLALKARRAATRRARHEAQASPGAAADPVAELTVRELQAVLDEELARLPERYRAPIVLCCLEGRSRDEAANCLGWTQATVKDRLEGGRERLRLRLARRGVLLGTALTSAWLAEGAASAGLSPCGTARAALLFATGQATLAALLPSEVAALAKGVTKTMLLSRVTILAVGIALIAGTTMAVSRTTGRVEEQAPGKAPDKAPATKPPESKPAPADTGAPQPEATPILGHRGAVNAIAFSPDGRLVATAGIDKTARLWDVATGVEVKSLNQPDVAVGVAISPDGAMLAVSSAGTAGGLTLWHAATGKEVWRTRGAAGAVAFSPDGKRVVAGQEARGATVSAVDAATGRMLFAFHAGGKGASTAVAFAPDGKLLAVGDGAGNVILMDGSTGKGLRSWRGKGAATALAFLPDGAKVAAADGGNAVRLLDVATGKQEVAFAGKEAIRSVAFSPDGRRIATAAADGTVVLWDATGKQERQFLAGSRLKALAFSPNGNRLATAGADGVVLWDMTRDEKPLPKDFKLTEKDLKTTWADLASDEGGKAYAAARMLRADPTRAVPFLQSRLQAKPVTVDQKKIQQLVADLDADEFAKREAATRELEKLGQAAEAVLRNALAAGPSPEAKLRLERLVKPLDREGKALTAEQQRDVRAVRVLEQSGTPEAKRLLEALSKEAPGWWVTREAREALQRLTRRDTKP